MLLNMVWNKNYSQWAVDYPQSWFLEIVAEFCVFFALWSMFEALAGSYQGWCVNVSYKYDLKSSDLIGHQKICLHQIEAKVYHQELRSKCITWFTEQQINKQQSASDYWKFFLISLHCSFIFFINLPPPSLPSSSITNTSSSSSPHPSLPPSPRSRRFVSLHVEDLFSGESSERIFDICSALLPSSHPGLDLPLSSRTSRLLSLLNKRSSFSLFTSFLSLRPEKLSPKTEERTEGRWGTEQRKNQTETDSVLLRFRMLVPSLLFSSAGGTFQAAPHVLNL